jgi:hypothetical protein
LFIANLLSIVAIDVLRRATKNDAGRQANCNAQRAFHELKAYVSPEKRVIGQRVFNARAGWRASRKRSSEPYRISVITPRKSLILGN